MEKYNNWTVIGDLITINGKKKALCKCKCGKEKYVYYYSLKTGGSKSCSSCAGKSVKLPEGFKKSWLGNSIGELSGTMFSHIKSKAAERSLEFNITKDFLWNLFVKQKHKCALSGIDICLSKKIKQNNPDFNFITASVDRIDSSIGYIESNVQWVHKDVNKMKTLLRNIRDPLYFHYNHLPPFKIS